MNTSNIIAEKPGDYATNKIVLFSLEHNGKKQIKIDFSHDNYLKNTVKKLNGIKWSQTNNCWYVENKPQNLREIFALFRGIAWVDANALFKKNNETKQPEVEYKKVVLTNAVSTENIDKINKLAQWLNSKRYSKNTIKTYSESLKTFFKFYHNKQASEINNQDIINFNTEYILRQKLSSSFQNQVVNAIKLFFSIIENRNLDIELIHRPRREKKLPNVLSKEEVKTILNALGNIKHKAMLSLIYSCGLRRSELLNLKPADVDSKRGILKIRQSKGKKDRIAPLSKKIVELLREYYKVHKPNYWLFEGQNAGEQYDERSLQLVLKSAVTKAKISKPVTLHWLRHSFATHLLESGTDLRYIQEILGHNSSRTTEIYTHVSTRNIQNIISPYDDL